MRVRGLLALFTMVVAGAYTLQLLVEQTPGVVPAVVAAMPTAMLTGWAAAHYRGWPRPLTDAVLIASMAGLALTVPTEGWIWGPAFLVLFQRGLDAGRVTVWLWSAVSFLAYQGTVARIDGVEQVLTINTIATAAEYVVATLIVRVLAGVIRSNEEAWRRERLLSSGSSRLLAAESTQDVAEVAAATVRELTTSPTATGAVWTAVGRDRFARAAAVGGATLRADEIDLRLFPPSYADAIRAGRPFVSAVRALPEVYATVPPDDPHRFATAPVVVGGEVVCLIVLRYAGRLADDLLEVLVRFANEVASAWQRVELLGRLREANEGLRVAAELKDQFLSTVSHELRTPLTSVLGFVDLLRRRWDAIDDEARREYVELIGTQAERQRELIEDLLSMSQIVGRHLTVAPARFPVRMAVEAAATTVGDLAVEVDIPLGLGEVWADRRHVEQILTNLLTNARKYGEPPVRVSVSSAGERLRVAVSDRGPGVPAEFVDRLFERFSQANASSRRSSAGFGLGLAISAELADANGATLTYEPTVGGGATFVVHLPVAGTTRASSPPEVARAP